jgi:uncharacterized membrane protein
MLDQAEQSASPAVDGTATATRRSSSARRTPWVLAAGGAIGLTAAVVLLVEKIKLIEDPDYIPSCSINPILSCGSIMRTDQAEAFGFPNPIIGVAGFAVVITVGVAILAGASFARWFWLGLQVGVTFGVGFVHWLIFQSLYRIDALCPYCMAVWAVMIPLFWYVTLHNARDVHLGTGRVGMAAQEYHGVVLTAWYLVIIGLVGQRFWDYWSTLLV